MEMTKRLCILIVNKLPRHCKYLRTYVCNWQLGKTIHGLDFPSITKASNLAMVHLVMNDGQNLVWPHYKKRKILEVVLMVCLLVVDMLNVFPLISTM